MPVTRAALPASAVLHLELDAATNRMWLGGVAVSGRRRWEAAFLALLTQQHDRPTRACQAADLNEMLASLGQSVALNRKQVSRLLASLDETFQAKGLDLAARLRHAPRQRTVGPWWWRGQPGDRILLRETDMPGLPAPQASPRVGSHASVVPLPAHRLPRLARQTSLRATLNMCRLALSYQPNWEGGPYDSVLPILADGRPWRAAAPEMRAMRWLLMSSSHLHTRQLALGMSSLARADRILAQDRVASAYLATWALTLRIGLARIDPDETRRRQAAELQRAALSHMPGSQAPEADRLSRLFLFAFSALTEQQALWRALERHAQADVQRHVQQAARLHAAALFCAFTGRHFDHMVSLFAHVGSFAHGLVEAGLETDVRLPLEWFILANQATHKLSLTDATGLATAGLGHCWLLLPRARRAFNTLARQQRWAGPRPDSLEFYLQNRDETRAWGDPRYLGKALLNLLHFTREFGPQAEARHAAQAWRQLCLESPGLADILRAEGWNDL